MIRKLAPIVVLLGTFVASGAAHADRGHRDRGTVTRDHRGDGRSDDNRVYDRRDDNRDYRHDNRAYRTDNRAYRTDRRVYSAPRVYYRPRFAPPALRVEVVRPRPGYFWVNGRYDWRDDQYVWNPGYYEAQQQNRIWVPGGWKLQGEEYVWIDGYWQDRPNQIWVDGRYEWRGGVQVWLPGYWINASVTY